MKICPVDGFIHPFFEVWQSTLGLPENFTSYNERGLTFLQFSTDNKQALITLCCAEITCITGKIAVFSEYKCV